QDYFVALLGLAEGSRHDGMPSTQSVLSLAQEFLDALHVEEKERITPVLDIDSVLKSYSVPAILSTLVRQTYRRDQRSDKKVSSPFWSRVVERSGILVERVGRKVKSWSY